MKYKIPFIGIAVSYMCGIVASKYSPFSLEALLVVALVLVCGFIIKDKLLKMIWFYACIFFVGVAIFEVSDKIPAENIKRYSGALREEIREIVFYNVPTGDEQDLLAGLFMGEREKISYSVTQVFRNTNTIHILAISGLHIGFMGIMMLGVFRMLMFRREAAVVCALLVVGLYIFIVGWRPPAFRSVIMITILFIGYIINRPVSMVNSLFVAAVVILGINPQALFDVGFILSFVVVLGLLLFVPLFVNKIEEKKSSVLNYFYQLMVVCICSWVSALPIVAYSFKVISPISILTNMFVVPAVIIIISLGFTSIALGFIYLPLSGVFNVVIYYVARFVIGFTSRVSELPFAFFRINTFPLWAVFVYYGILGYVFFSLSQKREAML